jgi:hypothetical protein
LASEKGTPGGQTRAEQLIATLTAIPTWRSAPATQCQALTVLVQLISTTEIPLKLKEVMNALEVISFFLTNCQHFSFFFNKISDCKKEELSQIKTNNFKITFMQILF